MDNENFDNRLNDDLNNPPPSSENYANETHKVPPFEEPHQNHPGFDADPSAITKEGKNIALIAHLTIIGWIIAIIMNSNTKSEFASFYIRQVLGLGICLLILNFIPVLGWILNIGIIILWIISLIGAASGEKKLTPVLGAYFQDWFKSL